MKIERKYVGGRSQAKALQLIGRKHRDVHAMVRQIGKPTFFLTFSAAEMRWPEFVEVIKTQQSELGDFSELDWNAKCDILHSNPITVMRMFEKRVDALMTSLILSPAKPIAGLLLPCGVSSQRKPTHSNAGLDQKCTQVCRRS
ncbi:hypothetical protein N1851_030970 [Merluccius polli]|uniref:Helitron helicase-like domain-containing protein n=1 Tax=Merluccius polli TaxID=89951 RepID=A0AA47M4J0_MERPO|nr:hypothetical protein N1851_030970 [Merluccius polli]